MKKTPNSPTQNDTDLINRYIPLVKGGLKLDSDFYEYFLSLLEDNNIGLRPPSDKWPEITDLWEAYHTGGKFFLSQKDTSPLVAVLKLATVIIQGEINEANNQAG